MKCAKCKKEITDTSYSFKDDSLKDSELVFHHSCFDRAFIKNYLKEKNSINKETTSYNKKQNTNDKKICDKLAKIINDNLPKAENKIWHSHPVWFVDENPIVGYSKLKDCIRLMFWSGSSFDEKDLKKGTGKFKDASIRYTDVKEINEKDLKRWIKKSIRIQWDYKNIYKTKGKLYLIKGISKK